MRSPAERPLPFRATRCLITPPPRFGIKEPLLCAPDGLSQTDIIDMLTAAKRANHLVLKTLNLDRL